MYAGVYVVKVEDRYVNPADEEGFPRVRINPYYRKILARRRGGQDDAGTISRNGCARPGLIKVWKAEQTIYKVAESIVKFQTDFLDMASRT